MAGQIFVATETFATTLDGEPVIVRAGETRVREGHALLKDREDSFKPLTVHYDVEEATAKPGEKRSQSKPSKTKE